MDAGTVLGAFGSGVNGLSWDEAARRLEVHGPNRLPEGRRRGPIRRFIMQFQNPLIYALLVAAAISTGIGHVTDALVIFAVVLLNAMIGFLQEGRAEQALSAIRDLVRPQATVRRAGHRQTVPAEAVVPGDIVLLEAGDRVPADLRLVEVRGLRIDEAALTGESAPVDKLPDAVDAGAALADRLSMAFSGTLVTGGTSVGVTVATGAESELGRIGTMIGAVEPGVTPLMRQMQGFARQVTLSILLVGAATFVVAMVWRGYAWDAAFMAVVGLAVAAIPEGLPAVMTVALAIGVQRMAARSAIVRHLPAVETLGAVSVICTDKTGTLTQNEMQVSSVVSAAGHVAFDQEDQGAGGTLLAGGGNRPNPDLDPIPEDLTLAATLCNDAHLRLQNGVWRVEGDPMEGALLALAVRAGNDIAAVRGAFQRQDAIPFDARRRYMASLHTRPGGAAVVYVKGAPERLLEMSAAQATPAGSAPLDRGYWARQIEVLAGDGQRVLALARGELPEAGGFGPAAVEEGLVLLGLVGLIDPPREEARTAIAECLAAGIAVKMVTGDHAVTARAIAGRLGLGAEPLTLTGRDLDLLDEPAFSRACRDVTVFARTSPEHKLRLVGALQAEGLVVAMTGDGVNDAPALKRADIGVSMGGRGTEAAKEASAIVLADDNFASIVAAVREGRTVHDNIRKLIGWTLPTGIGEGLTIVLAIALGLTLPITAVQILWVNMVTTVALGLTLAFEPTEPGTMLRKPRPAAEPLLNRSLVWRIIFVSALVLAGTFGCFAWAVARGLPLETGRTMVVSALVVMEIFYLFSVRYVHGTSLTWQGVLGTRVVWIGIALCVVAQVAFVYAPPLQRVFGSAPLAPAEAAVVVALGPLFLMFVEIGKRAAMRMGPGAPADAFGTTQPQRPSG